MTTGSEPGFAWPPGWAPGRLDVAPRSVYPPYTDYRAPWVFDTRADRAEALLDALRGAELGDYDLRIVSWLAGTDNPTVATVVSWIHRARLAARTDTSEGRG